MEVVAPEEIPVSFDGTCKTPSGNGDAVCLGSMRNAPGVERGRGWRGQEVC
jgi:hypothetical protein